MKSVCILLSTYNGEKYLEEQLESLCSQEGVKTHILVRDDGSTDKTCLILDEWQNKGRLEWYNGQNLGFALSFINLIIQAPECDYYAFCDQDDIWMKDKLKRSTDILETIQNPVKLYCSNAYCYQNGQILEPIHGSAPNFDMYSCLLRNIAPGCTMVFSKSLRDTIKCAPPSKITAHDFWIFQVATFLGEVFYDSRPSMLYRQHENNQIGQKKSFKEIWKRRIKNVVSTEKRHEREEMAKTLLKNYGNIMSESAMDTIRNVAEYRCSFKRKYTLIFSNNYKMESMKSTIYLKLRILFNML